jgi:anthranilate phosphoribosyltransferase
LKLRQIRDFVALFGNKLWHMTSAFTWPQILTKLVEKKDLDRVEATWAMQQIMSGEATEVNIAAFMVSLRAKTESVDELAGLVDVMLENSIKLDTGSDAVDIVGTGGDLVGTVNISSMSSIVVASTGVPVLKHGSRSASGKTGSSEMLEALGIRLDLEPGRVAEVFSETGITFFFAQLFHPAMRHVAPVRRALGVPTTFNFLGPLANPVQPIATALGVSNVAIAPLMANELAARGRTALVLRGNDGLDELTTTDGSQVWQVCRGEVRRFDFDARDFGLTRVSQAQLLGGDATENAQVARELFAGSTAGNLAAVKDIVILNAASGIVAYQLAKDESRAELDLNLRFEDAISVARQAIETGAAESKLAQWVAATSQR